MNEMEFPQGFARSSGLPGCRRVTQGYRLDAGAYKHFVRLWEGSRIFCQGAVLIQLLQPAFGFLVGRIELNGLAQMRAGRLLLSLECQQPPQALVSSRVARPAVDRGLIGAHSAGLVVDLTQGLAQAE